MSRPHPTALKRRKEMARIEKQQEKARRRLQRKQDKAAGIITDDDSDQDLLAGDGDIEQADEDPSEAASPAPDQLDRIE